MPENITYSIELPDGRTTRWSKDQYDKASEKLYEKYPDAKIVRTSALDDTTEQTEDTYYHVALPDGRQTVWDAQTYNTKGADLTKKYPKAQISVLEDVTSARNRSFAREYEAALDKSAMVGPFREGEEQANEEYLAANANRYMSLKQVYGRQEPQPPYPDVPGEEPVTNYFARLKQNTNRMWGDIVYGAGELIDINSRSYTGPMRVNQDLAKEALSVLEEREKNGEPALRLDELMKQDTRSMSKEEKDAYNHAIDVERYLSLRGAGDNTDSAKQLLTREIYGDREGRRLKEKGAKIQDENSQEGAGFAAKAADLTYLAGSGVAAIGATMLGHPEIGAAIGDAAFATFAASSAGSAMRQARDAGATDEQTFAAGATSAAIMGLVGRIPFVKALGNAGRVASTEAAEATMKALGNPAVRATLEKETSKLAKEAAEAIGMSASGYMKRFAGQVASSTTTFAAMGGLEAAVPLIYANPDEYPALNQIAKSVASGAVDGAIMGVLFGGVNTGSEYLARRKHVNDQYAKHGAVVAAALDFGKGEARVWDAKSRQFVPVESVPQNGWGEILNIQHAPGVEGGAAEWVHVYSNGKYYIVKPSAVVPETITMFKPKGLAERSKRSFTEQGAEEGRAADTPLLRGGIRQEKEYLERKAEIEERNGGVTEATQLDIERNNAALSGRRDAIQNEIVQRIGKPFWYPATTQNGASQNTVHSIVYADGREVFVVSQDSEGNYAIINPDGKPGFLSQNDINNGIADGSIVDESVKPLDDYLDSRVVAQDAADEELRMSEDLSNNIASIIEKVMYDGKINIGTAESENWATVKDYDPSPRGGVVVETDKGDVTLSWQRVADAIGMPLKPMTNEEIAVERIKEETPDAVIPEQEPVEESVEPAATTEEAQPVEDNSPRDFRGNEIPLKDDGEVNETAFWNKDPEAWAKWNDEKRQDGGANSRGYIAKAKKKLDGDVKGIQKQLDNELDFDRIAQLEKQRDDVNKRIADLDRIEQDYVAAEAASNAEAGSPAAAEQATPAEAQPVQEIGKPQAAEPAAINISEPAAESVSVSQSANEVSQRIIDILTGKDKTNYSSHFFDKVDYPEEAYDEVVRVWDTFKKEMEARRNPLQRQVTELVDRINQEERQKIIDSAASQGKTVGETALHNATIDRVDARLKKDSEYKSLTQQIDAIDTQISPEAKDKFRQNAIGMLKQESAKQNDVAARKAAIEIPTPEQAAVTESAATAPAVPSTPAEALEAGFNRANERLQSAATEEERQSAMQEKRQALQDYYDSLNTGDETIVGTRADILQRMEAAGCIEGHIEAVREILEDSPESVEGFRSHGKIFIIADNIKDTRRAKLSHLHEYWHGKSARNHYPEYVATMHGVTVDWLLETANKLAGFKPGQEGYSKYLKYRTPDVALADEVISLSIEVISESAPETVDENLRNAGLDNQEIINFVKTIYYDGERRNGQNAADSGRPSHVGEHPQAGQRQDGGDSSARPEGDLGLQGSGSQEAGDQGAGSRGQEEVGTTFVKEGDKLTSYIDAPTGQESPSAPDETLFSLKREADSVDGEGKPVPGLRSLADTFLAKLAKKPLAPEELAIGSDTIGAMVDYMTPYLDKVKDGKRYLPEEIFGKGWTTIFKNGSYGRTMENTLICMRTLAYNDFVNAVQEKVGRPLTPTESFLASQMLYDIATDPQCLYCYVALDRKAYNGFLKTYIEQRDAVLDKYKADDAIDKTYRLPAQAKSRKNRKGLPADNQVNRLYIEYLDGRADTPSMRNRFNGWLDRIADGSLIGMKDLTSPETRQKVAGKGASYASQIDDAERYAQSASWAKKQEEYRAYNGEILTMPQRVVDLLNSEYGLRFYSFSEYSPAFIVENMQMVRDAALRGLVGLAYTKEIDFAKIFAPTGININISCYGREAEDGTVVMDTKQGADWGEAQSLRERYGNVGCVFVATNDRMVEWAIHQPWVDVVIPFHIVRTGEDIAKFYDWTNYTAMEADKDVKGRSRDIMPTEHMNDKDTFLRLCEERGLKPRFADLVLPSTGRSVTEDPNYMKLVNETRRSVNETVRIKPIFDLQEAKRSFDEFVDKGGYYAGWFTEEGAFERGVDQVAADVEAGKTAKDVDYGRQDIKASAEKLAAMAGKKKRPRSHQGTPRRIGDDRKELTPAQRAALDFIDGKASTIETANAAQTASKGLSDTQKRAIAFVDGKTTEEKPFGGIDKYKPKFVKKGDELNEENLPDFEYDLMRALDGGVWHTDPSYAFVDGWDVRVKGHEPNWGNFINEDGEVKHNILNVTVGDGGASNRRDVSSEYSKEEIQREFGVKVVDVNIENGTTFEEAINKIKSAVNEAAEEADALSSAMEKLGKDGVSIDDKALLDGYGLSNVTMTKKGDVVTLNKVVATEKKQGNGTRFMNDLVKAADERGLTLALTPDDSFGATSIARLKKFYKRFGFKDNKGRNADLTINESMVRRPEDGIRFRKSGITTEQDKEYMDAVNSGDIEKAGKMVRDAFKAAFPNTKIVDGDGEPAVLYHGTKMQFWSFDGGKTRGVFNDGLNFFALDKKFAEDWATRDDAKRRPEELNKRLEDARKKKRQHEMDVASEIMAKHNGEEIKYYETPEFEAYIQDADGRKQWERENLGLDGMTLNEAYYSLGKRVLQVFINSENPFNPAEKYDSEGKQMLLDLGVIDNPDPMTEYYVRGGSYLYYEKKKVVDELKKRGYDSIYLSENVWSDPSKNLRTLAVWDASRVKSADPVTYDDNGNVIPLSERFNPDNDDNDIRFRKVNPIIDEKNEELFQQAKKTFGTTKDLAEAGYILPDGDMLDFSGRHLVDKNSDTSWMNGNRQVDHRDISDLNYEKDLNTPSGYETDMPDFIRRGAIRVHLSGDYGMVNLAAKPTRKQEGLIWSLASRAGGNVSVDFGDGWDVDHSATYENARPERIINDIRRYFDEGVEPDGNVMFRKTNQTQNGFISNAESALDKIKMEKATPEQWVKMLEKEGGLKAGEDKWLGLSDWLKEQDKKSITKEDVANFIAENRIQIEEVHYSENARFKDQPFYADRYDATESDDVRPADGTRLAYTTEGLDNKREIALTVPTIDPWQESDKIHFGDAGEGRAVAWIRFGETITHEDENEWVKAKVWAGMSEIERREHPEIKPADPGKTSRVLVIDEIQSNRHQEAREYFVKRMEEKYGKDWNEKATEEEKRNGGYTGTPEQKKASSDYEAAKKASDDYLKSIFGDEYRNGAVSKEYLDEHPLTYEQEEKIAELGYNVRVAMDRMEEVGQETDGVPAAPFEKNWHEFAMKRMLRLAAEEGYDKIAWTTGEQQAERYNIGETVNSIERNSDERFTIFTKGNGYFEIDVDEDGIVSVVSDSEYDDFDGKPLSDVVGKEMAVRMMSMDEGDSLSGEDLRIGGEGMKGFYDDILPRFMNKYGKKWGVKVQDINLPGLGETEGGLTMHSVDVTPEMKESVMEGQVMFRKLAPNGRPSNLTDKRWEMVRTPQFKKMFGDWELAAKLNAVEQARSISIIPHSLSGEELEDAYNNLPNGVNTYDGRNTEFIHNTYGKIIKHKGVPTSLIIPQLKEIYDNAVPIFSEKEEKKQGHKEHPNFVGYHHYLGKIAIDDKPYYVRLTVQELNTNPSKKKKSGFTPNQLHSTFISDVEIYENTASVPIKTPGTSLAMGNANGISDTKLQQFFEKARSAAKSLSIVVDENGEPLVVYHGGSFGHPTEEEWNPYVWESEDSNGWFARSKGYTQYYISEYGQEPIGVFLNIRNPFAMGDTMQWLVDEGKPTRVADDYAQRLGVTVDEVLRLIQDEYADDVEEQGRRIINAKAFTINRNPAFAKLLISKGYDGAMDIEADGSIGYMVTQPNQIKLADATTYDDNGNEIPISERFNPDNDDIRFRKRTKEDPKETIKVYKLMRLEDGKKLPLFIDRNSEPLEDGQWYDADSPDLAFLKEMPSGIFLVDMDKGTYTSLKDYQKERGAKATKWPTVDDVNEASSKGLRWMKITDTGKAQRRYEGENRKYENIGINGSEGVSTFAMRPGWHAGSLPTMRQIGKGAEKNIRDDRFVWVEGEIPADIDYNEEAQRNPDKDIPTHIPTDGYYLKATNADKAKSQADRVGWYVAGAFKPNRIIGDLEARQIIDDWNAEHPGAEVEYDWPREGGRVFNAETMQLENVPNENQKQIADGGKRQNRMAREVEKARTKGIAGVIGEEDTKDFYMDVYRAVSPEIRERIAARAEQNGWNMREAVSGYLSDLAAKPISEDETGVLRVAAGILSGYAEGIDEKTAQYILFRGEKSGDDDIIDTARDIAKRKMIGVGEFDEPVMFRKGSVVTPEQDKEYMDAVKAGDIEKAGKMVRDAFKAAFPDSKVVDENGNPRVVYHGTKWNPMAEKPGKAVFDVDRVGENFDSVDIDWNFFFTASEASARGYGNAVPVFLNITNPEVHTIVEETDGIEYDEETGHDTVVTAHDAGSENDIVTRTKNPDGVVYTIRLIHNEETLRRFSEAVKAWEAEHKGEIDAEHEAIRKETDETWRRIDEERKRLYEESRLEEFFGSSYDDMKSRNELLLSDIVKSIVVLNKNLDGSKLEELEARLDELGNKEMKIFRRIGIEGRPIYEDFANFSKKEDYHRTDMFALDNPNQIKSAEPITYDGDGNVIPLSERFNDENDDIRFRVTSTESNYDGKWKNGEYTYVGPKFKDGTPEAEMLDYIMDTLNGEHHYGETPWDAIGYVHNYISDNPDEVPTWTEDAANKFRSEMFLSREELDTEKLIRSGSFKKWFGDWLKNPKKSSKVVDEDGKPLVVYHGTRQGQFTKFNGSKHGIFFTSSYSVAYDYAYYDNDYGEGDEDAMVVGAYLDIKKPFIIDADYYDWKSLPESYNGLSSGSTTTDGWARYLMENHPEYDGMIVKNVEDGYGHDEITTVYAVFKPTKIKSADGTTYDDNGEPVPVGKRFNDENDDFRFRLADDIEGNRAMAGAIADDAKEMLESEKSEAKKDKLFTTVKAMSLQKEYDTKTVNAVTSVAKSLLKEQGINALTRHEIARLLGMVSTSVGRTPAVVKRNADALVNMIIDHLIKEEKSGLDKLMKVKASKVNSTGVEVIGALDVRGQNTIKAFKAGLNMPLENPKDEFDETTITGRLAALEEKMTSGDDAVRAEAEAEYAGLTLAKDYHENIRNSENEELGIKNEMKDAAQALRDGDMSRTSYRQFVKEAENSIRENQMERIEAYRDLRAKMLDMMSGSAEARKEFQEREKKRIGEILHNASSDMKGVSKKNEGTPTALANLANSSLVRFFMSPLATFDQMLRFFGRKSINGEGYLWNRYMRGWTDATENAFTGQKQAKKELDAKASEVFGKKMRWSDLYSVERKMPTVKVKWWDGEKMADHELTQGNLLYIYMVNKMSDGRMKLRRMGIDEDLVDAIKEKLDPRFIKLADWLQDEYLVDKRNKYNAVHERLFGASMSAIENYFPLKINKWALDKAEDIGRPDFDDALPATTTGSIIKRRRNTKPLDLLNADAFSVVIEHIEQMEQWAAFAAFNRDVNTLLSYKQFKNQLRNMVSVYGSGDTLYRTFKNVARIAGGSYRPAMKAESLDTAAMNIAKGVTAAKISFRVYTALKQFLSMPAFLSDASPRYLAENLATPWKAWNWAMENLPVFEKRWKSRIAGDTRLMNTDSDWKYFRSNIYDTMSKWGMSPNAFVDALTVSIGSHSMYQTRYERYIKEGYPEEKADKMAKQDATVLYNETQQSSEGAFVSPVQLDRTVMSSMITVFRNSAMGYQRQLHDAIRNLGKMMKSGYKQESIEFMAKQMVRDGLTEEQAQHAAERRYGRAFWHNAVRVATFGFIVQFAWNLGGSLAYLLFGDDDDEKKGMLEEAAVHALVGGSIEGLAGGNIASEAFNMLAKGESLRGYDPTLLPIIADAKRTMQMMGYDQVAGANELVNLAVQAGLGVNPQTLTDSVVAVIDACGGDLETSKEAMLLIMRVLQVPQSQVDKIYIDELGVKASTAKRMSYSQMARRYAEYKVMKGAPLTGWAYSDKAEEKREQAYLKRFKTMVNERKKKK